jgi:DNA modification methylase
VPTVATLSLEVRGSAEGVNQETTRREIIVAKHLADPEVRAAKNVNDAFKVLKRKEETQRNVQLAAEVGRTFSSAAHTLLNEDTLSWLEAAPAGVFDVILTDPPYGMNADEFGDSGGKAAGAHGYADSQEVFETCLAAAVLHFQRVTKPQAHLYWFCDIDKFHVSRAAFEAAGWWVHRTPIIWHKMNGSRVPWPEHGPQRKYELILYAVKGKKPVTHIYGDIISCASDENLGHAAQKPVALYQQLLQRSVRPGDQVLDCFGGTGTILVAAHEVKCKATYIERDPASYAIAVRRLEAINAQIELPLP